MIATISLSSSPVGPPVAAMSAAIVAAWARAISSAWFTASP